MASFWFSVLSINVAFVVRAFLPPSLVISESWESPDSGFLEVTPSSCCPVWNRVCGSPHVQGFVGPACSELSGCPPPPLATLGFYAFSISCPLLGFTAHIKPSPSPPVTWRPPTRKTAREVWVFMPSLCARSQCSLLHTSLPVARGTPGHLRQEPQCLRGAAKSILSWLPTKWKKERIFLVLGFFLPNLSSFDTEASWPHS